MVIRMFEYGFKKAKELAKYDGDDAEEIVIFIPKQLVIFVEENGNIKDEINFSEWAGNKIYCANNEIFGNIVT